MESNDTLVNHIRWNVAQLIDIGHKKFDVRIDNFMYFGVMNEEVIKVATKEAIENINGIELINICEVTGEMFSPDCHVINFKVKE